MFRNSLK